MAMGPGKRSTGWDFWSIESLFALATDLLHLSGLDDLLEMIGFLTMIVPGLLKLIMNMPKTT
jgi:hypothetical protein